MSKKAAIFFATGYEECEALITVDIMRRAGVEISMVSVTGDKTVTSSHNVPVVMDKLFDEVDFAELDMMILPGGMPGTRNLAAHECLMDLMKRHHALGGTVAAICAAPGLVVSQLDNLEGVRFTCYDGFEEHLIAKGAEYVKAPAVADGTIITGRGAGCAIDFGLKILEHLRGPEAAAAVRKGLMI